MKDHEPIEISQFNGLWNRGLFEAVPQGHCSDLLNIKFTQDGMATRDGFGAASLTIASVRRSWVYKVYGQADRELILDGSGNLYDSTNLSTPILTIASMTDFAAVNFAGRAIISPSNGSVGLSGEALYIYNGSGVARKAAGAVPTGVMAAVNSATSGNVEKGFHLIAVVYETESGFLTAPGPQVFASVTATGDFSVDISGIPTGPSYVSARRILMTQIITDYNGNQNGYEFFFVPNGRIADNSTATLTISCFDADLFTSADYLFDLYDEIPAMVWLTMYNGRLVGGGENSNPSVVRISEAGQPEAFNEVTGLLLVDPSNTTSPVNNGQELRGVLHLFKRDRTYGTSDNNMAPATWQVTPIDKGVGTGPHGIATVTDADGVSADRIFVASLRGLEIYTGVYQSNEASFKIFDLWKRINKVAFNTINLAHDPVEKIVYCAVPLDAATTPSHILVCNYANYDPSINSFHMAARWSIWTLASSKQPQSITVETNTTTGMPVFRVGVYGGNVYNLAPTTLNDYTTTAIPTPYAQFGVLPKLPSGDVLHTCGIRFKMRGSGSLLTTIYDRDKARSISLTAATMAALPGTQLTQLCNFRAQGFIVKIATASINEYFQCNGIKLFVKESGTMYPG